MKNLFKRPWLALAAIAAILSFGSVSYVGAQAAYALYNSISVPTSGSIYDPNQTASTLAGYSSGNYLVSYAAGNGISFGTNSVAVQHTVCSATSGVPCYAVGSCTTATTASCTFPIVVPSNCEPVVSLSDAADATTAGPDVSAALPSPNPSPSPYTSTVTETYVSATSLTKHFVVHCL